MSQLSDRLYAQARIHPISAPNRVVRVTKQEDGGLRVELASGRMFKLDKDDAQIQAFVVYTMLNDGCH